MASFKRIPQEIIEEIKAKNDIASVVSQYVKLERKGGQNLFGLCPFHSEKTPSFSVSPQKQIFYCFGCHKGGDVFKFIQEHEHLTYLEAIRFLAERAHVHIPETDDPEEEAKQQLRASLYAINEEAARFFYRQLTHPTQGSTAIQYLKKRQIDSGIAQAFGLGYAPNQWHALYDHLKQQGYRDDVLLKSGLFRKNKRGELYDFFRHRLIFPIIDTMGRILAFGGRALSDEDQPKYLNSPETLIYHKGDLLFAMNLARKSKANHFILVEGYLDAIALHQAGFPQAVAVLGTALTPRQIRQLKHYKNDVIVSFDADEAGQTAAKRSFELLQQQHLNIRVLMIPQGKDPDEYLKNNGQAAFKALLDQALSVNDYLFKNLLQQSSPNGYVSDEICMPLMADFVANMTVMQRAKYVDALALKLGQYTISDIQQAIDAHLRLKEQGDAVNPAIKPMQNHANATTQNMGGEMKTSDVDQTHLTKDELRLFILLTYDSDIFTTLKQPPLLAHFKDHRPNGFPAQVLTLAKSQSLDMTMLQAIASGYRIKDQALSDVLNGMYQREFDQDLNRDIVLHAADKLAQKIIKQALMHRRDWLCEQMDRFERHKSESTVDEQLTISAEDYQQYEQELITIVNQLKQFV